MLYTRYVVLSATGSLSQDPLPIIAAAQVTVRLGLGFAIESQARRTLTAETGSLSYGLVVHLLLLSTPPHGDAVTVGYRL